MKAFSRYKRGFRRIHPFFRPYLIRLGLGLGLAIPVGMLEGVVAYLTRPYIDRVVEGDMSGLELTLIPATIIVFALVQSALDFGSDYFANWAAMGISNDLKHALFAKLAWSDAQVFDAMTSGEVMVRYNADADTASQTLLDNINTLVKRGFTSVSLIIVLFLNSWLLAVISLSAFALIVIPLPIIKRKISRIIKETVVASQTANSHYLESFSGNRAVASYSLQNHLIAKLDETLKRMFRLRLKKVRQKGFLSLILHFAVALGLASAFWLQGWMIVSGRMTIGTFASFMTALLMLYTPVKKMSANFERALTALLATDRIMEILDREPKVVGKPGAARLDRDGIGTISYSRVSFHYQTDRPVLKDVDFEVHPGESVAFVGGSGGGKSTLVSLLPRFYDVDSGSISVGGVDVRDLELGSLRDAIAMVFQDNFLFGGTIRDNIMLGNFAADEAQLRKAITAACLDDFLAELPRGLDTEIGERGVMLSGGQRQRIGIARAFIKNAPIVILDEATSALDNKSEIVVQRAMENLMHSKTVFIVAHRLSTIINADRIMVVVDGRIAESGAHGELIAKNGAYASLYKTQI
ncbi:MAG: ABC transporter ATP-binding protein/permease [Planctomycetota bacterium]|jgi:subfamily B ATP-binding cassette protein MsbA|nr:ABC transporter ATP-binding protein/permease [Planctomycetota bacterium]